MLEQPEMGQSRGVAIVSLKLALSQETRASLEAVRAAQEGAQRRARQQTVQARIWFVLLVGAVALGAHALRPRLAHWRQSRAKTTQPARTSPQASVQTSPQTPPQMSPQTPPQTPTQTSPQNSPITPGPAATATLAHVAQPESDAQSAVAKAPAKANDRGVPAEGCDTSTRSGLWRRSPEACARAFAADPKNASLALAVAQAEHAHARLDEAAQWAKRALALDPKAAEAYVIIARADTENGRDEDARTAYGRYLEIAPHGWHKAEARAALRPASSRPR
jgi:tetratricopeptide (TPR) repeat protein